MTRATCVFIFCLLATSFSWTIALDVTDPSRRLTFGQLLTGSLALQRQANLPASQVTKQTDASLAIKPYEETLAKAFPRAMTYSSLARRVSKLVPPTISRASPSTPKVLLATSLCCDEVNRGLEQEFGAYYGDCFSMGGLAGFPFSGVTGFQAMQSHIPNDGSALIVYGPHVGIDEHGTLGQLQRAGQGGVATPCCGSAAAAAKYVMQPQQPAFNSGETHGAAKPTAAFTGLDMEQSQVNSLLLSHKDALSRAADPTLELPYILFNIQNTMLRQIVQVAGSNAPLALLGGIQINTPIGASDYFLPLVFDAGGTGGRRFSKSMLEGLYDLQ
ncbi:hypothetical protein MPSEU_001093700 [Mayamaea pseudoterrestris]|nr:hypothetical protein MPSEU_001093700 [Mayamaea pseudoterrestris]